MSAAEISNKSEATPLTSGEALLALTAAISAAMRGSTGANGGYEATPQGKDTDVKIELKEPKAAAGGGKTPITTIVGLVLLAVVAVISVLTLVFVILGNNSAASSDQAALPAIASATSPVDAALSAEAGLAFRQYTPNVCQAKKPGFDNSDCIVDGVVAVAEQAGGNVTKGYVGGLDVGDREPITTPYWQQGLCPVNVHWHLGAEHLSAGEYDEEGSSPASPSTRKLLATSDVREGQLCHHYDASNEIYTTEYDWKHCSDMQVGQTYEVHWPHSAAGACGTIHQFQTPFYDGVFCTDGIISLSPLNTFEKIGVQAQVFTVVNDDRYYYPDLMRGMIVNSDLEMGMDMAYYTGSTTGTSRDNNVCSNYTPITWQVDRKCHLISASTFDKMCADMKAQLDDMSDDVHPHGSRELVIDALTANNQQDK